LTQLGDRIEAIARVVFMFRVTRAIFQAHFPDRAINPEKRDVRIVPGAIEKKVIEGDGRIWGQGAGKTKAEWAELHQLVAAGGPPSLVRATFTAFVPPQDTPPGPLDATKILLSPVGYIRRPATEAECRALLRDVLEALAWLHGQDWVHRDVREPNVVRKRDGRRMLIDLEAAAPIRDDNWSGDGVVAPVWKPQPAALRWEPRHDLWQLAHSVVDGLPLAPPTREELAAGIDVCGSVGEVWSCSCPSLIDCELLSSALLKGQAKRAALRASRLVRSSLASEEVRQRVHEARRLPLALPSTATLVSSVGGPLSLVASRDPRRLRSRQSSRPQEAGEGGQPLCPSAPHPC